MKGFYILLFSAIFTISCNSVKRTQKYLSQGDYDDAIELAVKKLQKDKSAKQYDEHIGILEESYKRAVTEDKDRLSFLKKQTDVNSVKEAYFIYLDLYERQNLVKTILPLYSRELKRNILISFSDYSSEISNAKTAYTSALYKEANIYLQRNSRLDYRSAYNVLCELDEVSPNYKDVQTLKEEAHFKGTDFVFVTLNNHSGQIIPFRLQQYLLDFNTYGLDDLWTEYHSQRENGINYNFGVELNFNRFSVSPERIRDTQIKRNERIRDGYDYKRDRYGNIVKDSLGNAIKTERFKNVAAVVTVTEQEKATLVEGTVVYRDLNKRQVINDYPLASEFIFEHIFASYRGDEEALTGEDRRLISNGFIPFPNNEQMVLDAGENIKQQLKSILEQNKFQ